jgi:NADPH2:quinone reductase
MRAAFYHQPGPPEVIQAGELPTPAPGSGEVLVHIAAATVNPIDTYIRGGVVNMPQPRPTIPGCDLAGTVTQVGPGASRFKIGDRVWGSNQGLLGRQGTCAEFAAVHEDFLYPTLAGVSDEQAAAAALVGITAHLGLFRCAKLMPGETVFVNGGTGGVGSLVVQMAKAAGAKAITTVGSAEKAVLAKQFGADAVFNYKTDDVAKGIKDATGGMGVNVWYETLREPDYERMVELTAKRGRIVVMAGRQARPPFPHGPFYVKDLSLFGFAMFNATPGEQRHCAEDISRWLAQKKLTVPIGKRFSLAETAAAHRLQEQNTLEKAGTLSGKIVIVT